jgi:hypothetical protein
MTPIHVEQTESTLTISGLDASFVRFCLAGAVVALYHYHGHASGVSLKIEGSLNEMSTLHWENIPSRRLWGDRDHATEYGASGVSFVIIEKFTPFFVHDSFAKGDGFDFMLVPKGEQTALSDEVNFAKNYAAKLEVSGTQNAEHATQRLKQKRKQLAASGAKYATRGYAIVVDFETPKALIAVTNANS